DYLLSFEGCLLIVSHDRYFLDKIVDHTFYFKGDGKIKDIFGNYTAYRAYLKEDEKADKLELKNQQAKLNEPVKTSPVIETSEKKKLSYKEKLEFESLEKEIKMLQTENMEIVNKMNDGNIDTEELKKLSLRMTELAKLIDAKENRW